jgi:hypothetical protein
MLLPNRNKLDYTLGWLKPVLNLLTKEDPAQLPFKYGRYRRPFDPAGADAASLSNSVHLGVSESNDCATLSILLH